MLRWLGLLWRHAVRPPHHCCKGFALQPSSRSRKLGKALKKQGLGLFPVGLQIALVDRPNEERARKPRAPPQPLGGAAMDYKEIFWMACDSTEQLRAEYGPFHTRAEAEAEAHKLGFRYLLRYEHLLDKNEEIQEVRCIFIELPGAVEAEA